jgi:hypothetical protein
MKAIQDKVAFAPVIVALESQEEVDTLYAILNHAWVVDGTSLEHCHEHLEALASPSNSTIHRALTERLEAKVRNLTT